MRVNAIDKTSFDARYTYKINGKENKEVKYLYNKVLDSIQEKGVSGNFELGKDVITLSTESKTTATFLDNAFEKLGIKLTKSVK